MHPHFKGGYPYPHEGVSGANTKQPDSRPPEMAGSMRELSGDKRRQVIKSGTTVDVSGARGCRSGFGHQEAAQADGEEEASQAAEAHTHPAPPRRQVTAAHLGQPNSSLVGPERVHATRRPRHRSLA